MENQNIQWENWEEQPQENNEQPQVNWGEQPQQKQPLMDWGEQPQETNIPNWGEQPQETNIPNWGEQPQETNIPYTLLDSPNKITITPKLYKLNANNLQAVHDILNSNLVLFDHDGRYDFNPSPNTELGNIINSIVKIGLEKNLKIDSCFVYKAKPNESSLNIFKGKPANTFIYHLDNNSGDIVLDLTSLAGPAIKSHPSEESILAILPGWVPYRIGKNNSNQESYLLVGNFI